MEQNIREAAVEIYEPPALVGLGEFSEDTLGWSGSHYDSLILWTP